MEWFNNRENDDPCYMFRSYNNCYYSSSEPVSDEEDELYLQSNIPSTRVEEIDNGQLHCMY